MKHHFSLYVLVGACLGCGTTPARLTIEPPTVTVEYSPTKDQHDVELTLRNNGDEPLQILGVRTSCSCTVANLPKDTLLTAQRSTKLALKVSPSMFGDTESTITVVTDSILQPAVDFKIRMTGSDIPIPHLLSQTQQIELSGYKSGELLTGTLEVRTVERSGKESWIAGLESNSDVVKSQLRTPVEEADLGGGIISRWYVFEVSASCPESEILNTKLKLQFREKHPDRPTSSNLTVCRLERVRCVPKELIVASLGNDHSWDLLVLSPDQEPFPIVSVDFVSADQRIPLPNQFNDPSVAHKLEITYPNPDRTWLNNPTHVEIQTTIDSLRLKVPIVQARQ